MSVAIELFIKCYPTDIGAKHFPNSNFAIKSISVKEVIEMYNSHAPDQSTDNQEKEEIHPMSDTDPVCSTVEFAVIKHTIGQFQQSGLSISGSVIEANSATHQIAKWVYNKHNRNVGVIKVLQAELEAKDRTIERLNRDYDRVQTDFNKLYEMALSMCTKEVIDEFSEYAKDWIAHSKSKQAETSNSSNQ